jgi:hypothetical protein
METFRATSDTVVCTLTQDDLKETVWAWKKLLRVSLVSRQEIPGGLRLTVDPRSEAALRQLIDIERECCRWITFKLDGPSVTITAAGGGESAIRETWDAERQDCCSPPEALTQ